MTADKLEWIPDWRTTHRIQQLPAIIDELRELDGTRNPDDSPAVHQAPVFGSKTPCNETVTFLLDPREDSHWGGLARLQDVSRIVWDALGPDGRQSHPQPTESSWAAETAWLAPAWLAVVNTMPEVQYTAGKHQIDALYGSAAAAIGLKPPKTIPCPDCGAPLLEDGDVLVCAATARQPFRHEYPGARRIIADWADHKDMTTAEAVEQIPGCTARKLGLWRDSRKIKPAAEQKSRHGRPTQLWRPWDIVQLVFPGITETLTEDAA